MTLRQPATALLIAALFLLTAPAPAPARVIELRRHENREFHFAFQYPASWRLNPDAGGDLRARTIAPAGGPEAQCSVIVKRFPNAAGARQGEIDPGVPRPAHRGRDHRYARRRGTGSGGARRFCGHPAHPRPAHQAALRYTVVTPVGPARAYGRVVLTATPGLTWTISCSGQGTTNEEAERNFAFWGLEIDALVASFRFTPAAPQPAPAAAPATTPDKK